MNSLFALCWDFLSILFYFFRSTVPHSGVIFLSTCMVTLLVNKCHAIVFLSYRTVDRSLMKFIPVSLTFTFKKYIFILEQLSH